MPEIDLKIMKRGEATQRIYDLHKVKGTTKELTSTGTPGDSPEVSASGTNLVKRKRGRPRKDSK